MQPLLMFATVGLFSGACSPETNESQIRRSKWENGAAAKKDLAELQGRWECLGVIGVGLRARDGEALFYGDQSKPGSLLKRALLEVKGDAFTFAETAARKATVKLDPGQSPKAIDLTDAKGKIWIGVYDLKDDTLTINFSLGQDRPKKVTYQANGTFGQVNVSYRRAKKVMLYYRTKGGAVGRQPFSTVGPAGVPNSVQLQWDLLETQAMAKNEFDQLLKMLDEKQIRAVQFEAEGAWVKKDAVIRLIAVPRLTEAGKRLIEKNTD